MKISNNNNKMKVAIIHYWLVNMRGGEKVIEALLEMYPQADIYTHVYAPNRISSLINSKKIITSRINNLPFAKKLYPVYMPLMPKALLDFNLQDYDLVISSESGPAKGVVVNPDAFHVCYCHSPMRYLWDMYHDYLEKSNILIKYFMRNLIPRLRLYDVISSNLVDCFIANSGFVAKRIKRYYNRDSIIINPPVNIEKFINIERKVKDYYLFFGEITGYKRVDIAIEACIQSGRKLIVAGKGAKKNDIKKWKRAGLIEFETNITEDKIKELYSGAKALLFPGIEDFGIVPVEAQAAGCPVIAFNKGGAVETVQNGVTGLFFNEQTPESLIKAIEYFENNQGNFNNRNLFIEHVRKYDKVNFMQKLYQIINDKMPLPSKNGQISPDFI